MNTFFCELMILDADPIMALVYGDTTVTCVGNDDLKGSIKGQLQKYHLYKVNKNQEKNYF